MGAHVLDVYCHGLFVISIAERMSQWRDFWRFENAYKYLRWGGYMNEISKREIERR